jgi:hypothetical protein
VLIDLHRSPWGGVRHSPIPPPPRRGYAWRLVRRSPLSSSMSAKSSSRTYKISSRIKKTLPKTKKKGARSISGECILDRFPKKRGPYWRRIGVTVPHPERPLVRASRISRILPHLRRRLTPSRLHRTSRLVDVCSELEIASRSSRICYPFNSSSWCGDVVLRRFARVRSQQASGGTWCSYCTKKSCPI